MSRVLFVCLIAMAWWRAPDAETPAAGVPLAASERFALTGWHADAGAAVMASERFRVRLEVTIEPSGRAASERFRLFPGTAPPPVREVEPDS